MGIALSSGSLPPGAAWDGYIFLLYIGCVYNATRKVQIRMNSPAAFFGWGRIGGVLPNCAMFCQFYEKRASNRNHPLVSVDFEGSRAIMEKRIGFPWRESLPRWVEARIKCKILSAGRSVPLPRACAGKSAATHFRGPMSLLCIALYGCYGIYLRKQRYQNKEHQP